MKDLKQQQLFSAIDQALLESEQSLDLTTLRKLQSARNTALAKSSKPLESLHWLGAAAVVALVAIVIGYQQPSVDPQFTSGVHQALLLSEDNSELIENLEFYRWLEQTAELEKSPLPENA